MKRVEKELWCYKNSVVEALCAKNEHLQHLVDELQRELEYAKANNEAIHQSNNFSHTENGSQPDKYCNESTQNTVPNTNTYYRVFPQDEIVYYKEKVSYSKNRLKDIMAFVITIICIIGIGFILWKIPATNALLVDLYQSNPPIKAVIDFFIGIFNK